MHHGIDEESLQWVRTLTGEGEEREEAAARLHAQFLRIARAETLRRSGTHPITGRELDDLVYQAASDATMSVLRRVTDFRGESKFATWAYKFVIYEVSSKLHRHVWARDGAPSAAEDWDQLPARLGAGPEDVVQSLALVQAVHQGVEQELTAHQRRVFVAIVLEGVPLDVLASELASNRNALYKTLFDARRKLRAHLVIHGYLQEGR